MSRVGPVALAACVIFAASTALAAEATAADAPALPTAWRASPPLVACEPGRENPCISVKDPTVVHDGGRWHVFMTVRSERPPVHTEYMSFERWEDADKAPRHVFTWVGRYCCAPQVFYFRPHKKWYLVFQVGEPQRQLKLQPEFVTTETPADPASWSRPQLFFPDAEPKGVSKWLDFWVICDEARAYLFFTSLDGNLWRMWTPLEKFPLGFDHCELALKADIFEAAHIYRMGERGLYLALIEAQGPGGRRYYKAYTAERLDGAWKPAADTYARPFAGAANVRFDGPAWAESISHGELLRASNDERLIVDPANLRFLFQGCTDADRAGKGYGAIPWRLGILTPATDAAPAPGASAAEKGPAEKAAP
jgi:hypothetical protein